MKLALRYIPTEVWVDVICYPWITRKQLGRIVDRFRNRYFAEILQYCLHERGKRTLRSVHLGETLLDIPRTPVPENIKFFEKIVIWHFDSQALNFLRRISTLFLLNHVNLDLELFRSEEELTTLRTIFDHLAPLLHGINSLEFHHSAIAIPLVEQYFGPKLAHVKLFSIDLRLGPTAIQTGINFCLNWLTSGEQDLAKPKFLEVYIFPSVFQQFSLVVQQQFQSAERPSTFAIKLHCHGGFDFQLELDLKNNIGEQLHGQNDENGALWIFCHPVDSTRTQLKEWVEEMVEKRDNSNRITLFPTLTIGQIDANDGENEVNDAVEEEAGPSTSGDLDNP